MTVVVVAIAAIALIAPPAVAAGGPSGFYQPPERYEEQYTFDPECPNVAIAGAGEVSGVSSLRFVPGSDGQAFLLTDRFAYEDTWTNTVTGKSFRVTGRVLFREVSAEFVPLTDVPADVIPPEGLTGPVYRFTAVELGRPFTVWDASGRVVAEDRGLAVLEALFDTLGDSQPGGTFLSDRIVRAVGPHPFLLGELDACVLAEQLTDNDPTNDPRPLGGRGDDDDEKDD
jgi:hypothetical protein